jgi:hypothetical protein
MEPILAISRPKIYFSQNIKKLIKNEFGAEQTRGIMFKNDSILVDESLLNFIAHHGQEPADYILKKLGNIFLTIMSSPEIIPYVDLIIVNKKVPHSPDTNLNRKMRVHKQQRAELILSAMYKTTPELEKKFGIYFTATAVTEFNPENRTDLLEFRFIPTEKVHIDVIQEFGKYLK